MIEEYLGIESDYIILGLAGVAIFLLLWAIINTVKIGKLNKRLAGFMRGKSAESLEDTLIKRLSEVDELSDKNAANERNIEVIQKHLKKCQSKTALVKYNALEQLGGNLSFALCILDDLNNGFIINVVHSREGCYTYSKEVIDGNSVIGLAEEEEQALAKAMGVELKK
jgi:hypothetical protein